MVSDTNLDYVLFEVTEDRDISEGRLVEARIGERGLAEVEVGEMSPGVKVYCGGLGGGG